MVKIRNFMLVRKVPFDQDARDAGRDWPADAETMIGMFDTARPPRRPARA
jgi:O-methyltransferase